MRVYRLFALLVLCSVLFVCASAQKKTKARQSEKDPQYQYELGLTALKYDLPDEAIKYFQRAIDLDPGHVASHYTLGVVYMQRQSYDEAAAAFQRCLELKPDHTDARLRLGYAYQMTGQLDKSEKEYETALALGGSAEAGVNLAKLYYDQKKLDLALEYAQKAIQKDGRFVPAYNLHGVILNELGRYTEAVASFQSLLKLDPNHVVAGINLAVAYINLNRLDDARSLLEQILPKVQEQTLQDRIKEILEKIKGRE